MQRSYRASRAPARLPFRPLLRRARGTRGIKRQSTWYGALSARLEALRTGGAPPARAGGVGGVGSALADLGRAARYELQKLLLVVAVGAALLPLNLVPGVGSAAAGLGAIALGATVACLDFFDAPLEPGAPARTMTATWTRRGNERWRAARWAARRAVR